MWGSDLFLPCVILQTVQFLCLLCSCTGLELGSCTEFHSALTSEIWCLMWYFYFSWHYSMSKVLQTNVILVSEIQDHESHISF